VQYYISSCPEPVTTKAIFQVILKLISVGKEFSCRFQHIWHIWELIIKKKISSKGHRSTINISKLWAYSVRSNIAQDYRIAKIITQIR
jgi:hypothetical protein